jgi:uncharacterized protein
MALGALAVPVFADVETMMPGKMLVNDDAKLFTPAGIEQAKKTLGDTLFDHGLSIRVSTFEQPPESKKAEVDAAKNDKTKWNKFMQKWAHEQAPNEGAKGIFILICRHPGGVGVAADDVTRDRGFSDADTAKVDEILTKAFADSVTPDRKDKPDAATIRDAGLKAATDYIVTKLKDTTVKASANAPGHANKESRPAASPLMGYLCMGIVVVLCIWLMVGLVRAFSRGGTGGGGFMTSLFAGLFGAMAGMWLYNNFFGGGGMFGGGSDAYAGDGGGDFGGDDGTGHFGGDPEAGGYDGGGDWGGGGGDFGGGDF